MTDASDFPLTPADIWLRRDLVAKGWTDRDIRRAMKGGLIDRVRYGAYADAAIWRTLDARGRHRARSRAVLKAAHESTVLSHQSSIVEWDVPVWRLDLSEVAITRTDGKSGRREAGIQRHSGELWLEHLTMRHGVPITAAGRAAVEILTVTDLELGLAILNGMLNKGHTTIEQVKKVAGQAQHWPETLNLRLAIGLADKRLSSIAESRFVFLCYREGVPIPVPQVEVFDERGVLIGIVDFLWRTFGVFLEFDGKIKYAIYRRPGETLDEYLMREKKREERICQETGWVCIRIGWADLESPAATARRIMALIASRGTPAA